MPIYFKNEFKKVERVVENMEDVDSKIKIVVQERECCKRLKCRFDKDAGKPVINNRDEIEVDCGIVARYPNPYNPRSKLFIFAGCHTYGTAAAAKVAASKSILHEIECECPAYLENEFFTAAIQISVKVADPYYCDPDLMEVFYPLEFDNDGKLQVNQDGIVRNLKLHHKKN